MPLQIYWSHNPLVRLIDYYHYVNISPTHQRASDASPPEFQPPCDGPLNALAYQQAPIADCVNCIPIISHVAKSPLSVRVCVCARMHTWYSIYSQWARGMTSRTLTYTRTHARTHTLSMSTPFVRKWLRLPHFLQPPLQTTRFPSYAHQFPRLAG